MTFKRRTTRTGSRRHTVSFEKHNGDQYAGSGTPTYDIPNHWDPVVENWPCEIVSTAGGENIRGRQVSATTQKLLIGEYFGAEKVTPDMRAIIDGTPYGIAAVLDPWGDKREMRIECWGLG